MLRMASKKHVPRGCRSNYIPGLTDKSKSLYEAYKKQYSIDPFGETTIDTGNTLIDWWKMRTTCTLFTPDPAEYTSNLDLTINNKALPMATHPKVLGLTLDPKLAYSTHIHNISVQAHKPLQIIKTLAARGCVKETLMATYKAVMRPALEYASSVWSPISCSTNCKSCRTQHRELPQDAHNTNIQHLHDETLTLPIHEHIQLYASQYKQKTQHPLHKHTTYFNTPRLKN